MPLVSGVDWNPVSGHWIVSGKWTPDYMNFVVLGEYDVGQGYAIELTDIQAGAIMRLCHHGNVAIIESGGMNEEYIKWFWKELDKCGFPNTQVHLEEWVSVPC